MFISFIFSIRSSFWLTFDLHRLFHDFQIVKNKSGEINPRKIQSLVEGYIKKVKHTRKKNPQGAGGTGTGAGGTASTSNGSLIVWYFHLVLWFDTGMIINLCLKIKVKLFDQHLTIMKINLKFFSVKFFLNPKKCRKMKLQDRQFWRKMFQSYNHVNVHLNFLLVLKK